MAGGTRKILGKMPPAEFKKGFVHWDALIVQAAGSCGAEVIYSEDLADGQSYVDVRVINPLK